jgi:POT family proton-dependent oligopeptide transporter
VKYGPGVAFGVPGILMAIATFVFWLGRHHYVHVPPTGKDGPAGFLPVFTYALTRLGDYGKKKKREKMENFIDMAKEKFTPAEVEGTKAAFGIFILYATVSVFWALFDQQGSTWTLQAREMDLNFMGMQMAPDQIQALNPIMVMALIPFFSLVLYPGVEKLGIKVTPLRKMSAGMVVAGLSFAIVAVFQHFLDSGVKLNAMWQFIPYLVITMAEVMVSITGLEFAYTQAPRAMKSTIMSFWLLTVFVGNFLAAGVSSTGLTGAPEFWFYSGLMLFVSVIFMFSASRYKTRNYMETA